ncbi:flagellar hook-basal body complex protein FliE [Alcaligenaceae bacterium SJ-26]|nr:flagellar hook-basal body complex protein FliE [Alcaligenaceae bacterium SJ-26]
MSIQKLSGLAGIEQMLLQMRAVVRAAGMSDGQAEGAVRQADAAQGSFASELKRSLQQVASLQESSYAQAKAFEMGDPGVALNDVMIDLQKSGIAFQTSLQVRNKLVTAYQEIASMSI